MLDEKLKGEAIMLVRTNIADNIEDGLNILKENKRKDDISDLLIFFKNISAARGLFPEMHNEAVYDYSDIRTANVPSGRLEYVFSQSQIALGALKEFANDNECYSKLVCDIRNVKSQDTNGIFLSPFKGAVEKLAVQGKQTYDQKHNLFRVEFDPIDRDFVKGMFVVWDQQFGENIPLITYIHKSKVYDPNIFNEKT